LITARKEKLADSKLPHAVYSTKCVQKAAWALIILGKRHDAHLLDFSGTWKLKACLAINV
jgi:hypothetical protein